MTETKRTGADTSGSADTARERDLLLARVVELERQVRAKDLAHFDHAIGLEAKLHTALDAAAQLRGRLNESKAESSRLRGLVKQARIDAKGLESTNRRLADELARIRSSRAWRLVRLLSPARNRRPS